MELDSQMQQMMKEAALSKLEFHKNEVKRWEEFIQNLDDGMVRPLGLSDLPVSAAPKPLEKKLEIADLVRDYFLKELKTDKKKAKARDVANWIIGKLEAPKEQFRIIKPKVYSQLATFEKQKKMRSKKGADNVVYYEWIGQH